MNALTVKIGSDISELRTGMAKAQDLVKGFQGSIESIAGSIGIAFGVQQVGSFALELTKLAGQVDGVKQAFDKLQGSAQVLNDLKSATKGTVSEFDLMKAAVQASNFKIPIEQLGSLFNFAYERAKATGQSVDYLVNSIVVGIGRKSPLILDNLGISAVELKNKLHGVSTEAATVGQVAEAVGKIATEANNQMGASAVTAAEKIAQIEANWENLKASMGKGAAYLLSPLLEGLNNLTGGANAAKGQFETLFYEAARTGKIKENFEAISDAAKKAGIDLNNYRPSESLLQYWSMVQNVMGQMNGVQAGPKLPGGLGPIAPGSAPTPNAGKMNHALSLSQVSANDLLKSADTSDSDSGSWTSEFQKGINLSLQTLDKELPVESTKKVDELLQQMAEHAKQVQYAIAGMGEAMGNDLSKAIVGAASFADAMRNMAGDVLKSLLQIAEGRILAWGAERGLPGLLLAGVGIGILKGLFASISGGGSGSVPATTSQRATAPVYQERLVTNISGQNLAVVLQRYQDSNTYTRPVGG